MAFSQCDQCAYLVYDEDFDTYMCDMDIDEDDTARLFSGGEDACPYFRLDDEYGVVRHQN